MRRTQSAPIHAIKITMKGLVQGQGIRPSIARLADKNSIFGEVFNSLRGVEIFATASRSNLVSFEDQLRCLFPQATFEKQQIPSHGSSNNETFVISASKAGEEMNTSIPLDCVICAKCLDELRDKSDRRFGYPFVTCASCGPRFSIIKSMPFDRKFTSMNAFPMCSKCEAEYQDRTDRRYHAQTICCPECGPQCWVTNAEGHQISGNAGAIKCVAEHIALGGIAAVKGIGGYQLICDSRRDEVVASLRERKIRPSKPFAVMVKDVIAAGQLAELSETEASVLQCESGPIVVVRDRNSGRISAQVAPNVNTIGLMLPTTALHAILIDLLKIPVIVTSGNLPAGPIVFQNELAQQELKNVADVFLHHDRVITNPVDDSVVQCISSSVMSIRVARGLAPLVIPSKSTTPRLATGAHQKVAFAMQSRESIVLASHIGDMNTESSRVRFDENTTALGSMLKLKSALVVHDRHPNYFTTDWARRSGIDRSSVQHHHAHVLSSMSEHGLLNQTVLGFSFDGSGYGDDETIWGGEVLIVREDGYRRIGHLKPFVLPGGEASIRQPWRIANSLRSEIAANDDPVFQSIKNLSPMTSSMGRLFDGVAAMVLGIRKVDYEGEAAMRLEAACNLNESTTYQFGIQQSEVSCCMPVSARISGEDEAIQAQGLSSSLTLDWRPVLRGIQKDFGILHPGIIAMKFHRAVADVVCEIAAMFRESVSLLCGGVFQNRVLLELISEYASRRSIDIRMPGRIPVNDGGLAVGQLLADVGGTRCV